MITCVWEMVRIALVLPISLRQRGPFLLCFFFRSKSKKRETLLIEPFVLLKANICGRPNIRKRKQSREWNWSL
jgi:hypothetical protein